MKVEVETEFYLKDEEGECMANLWIDGSGEYNLRAEKVTIYGLDEVEQYANALLAMIKKAREVNKD